MPCLFYMCRALTLGISHHQEFFAFGIAAELSFARSPIVPLTWILLSCTNRIQIEVVIRTFGKP
jgi:hypothetical protein